MSKKISPSQTRTVFPPRPTNSGVSAGAEPSAGRRSLRLCDAAAGVIAAIMLLAVIHMSAKPVDWPQDCFSDMNTLLAGESFAQQGLVNMRFLPVHYAGPDGLGPDRNYYTHYPPLSDVVNGVVRDLGITSLAGMRVAAALFGIAGWLLLYRAIARAISPLAGVLGLAFVAGSGYFFSYGISVHQHSFNVFFLGLFLLFFLRWVQADRPKLWWLAVCWGGLMLESLNSFEFIMYAQVLAWAYVLATGTVRKHWKMLLVLASGPVAGVGLHYLQNVWALGWAGAWADKLGYGQYGGEARSVALGNLATLLPVNIERCFIWSWWLLALLAASLAAASWLSWDCWPQWRSSLALVAGAAIAPWAWYILMAAHAHHPHTVNQLMPLAMISFGGVAGLIGMRFSSRGRRWPGSVPRALGLALSLLAGGVVAVVMAYDGYKAVDRQLTPRVTGLNDVTVAETLGRLSSVPPKSAILFNITPEAHLAYFFRNYATLCPMRGLPFPDALPALDRCLPVGWEYSSYVFFYIPISETDCADKPVFDLLRTTCPGKALPLQAMPGKPAAYLFDIHELNLPPEQRKALDPAVREAQLQGIYPTWDVPGFQEELRKIASRKE
jgi:hypothetical protein